MLPEWKNISPSKTPRQYLAACRKPSFAYTTFTERLPVIITRAIDDIYRAFHALSSESEEVAEAKLIVEKVAELKYELMRDKRIRYLEQDGEPDTDLWNQCIEKEFPNGTWFHVSWLFGECYAYRRIREAIAQTKHWRDYDPFRQQKESAFLASHAATSVIALRATSLLDAAASADSEVVRKSFREVLLISLWGNRTDLSLHASMDMEDLAGLQHSRNMDESIAADDFDQLWMHVQCMKDARIDIVLDNAGFELLGDLLLADWLVRSGRARKVHFHAKAIPWFVSDTTPHDFDWTVRTCLGELSEKDKGSHLGTDANLHTLARRWEEHVKDDDPKWLLEASYFWTSPYGYWHLPDRNLIRDHVELSGSGLIIFKGDLNYRKLVYDCVWETTTPFRDAIGPLATWGPPILALRTCKADVVVGLQPGQKEKLDKKDPSWMVNGSIGLIQFVAKPDTLEMAIET